MQRKLASAEWVVIWDSAVLCWWEHADHCMILPVQRKGTNFLPWGSSSHLFENSVGSRSCWCPKWSMTASWMDFAKRRAALCTPQCLQVPVAAKSQSGHSGSSYSPKNSTLEPPMPCTKARSSCWIASAGTLEQVASMLASYDQQAMLASQSLQECGRNQGASLISDMCVGACQELLAAAFPWSSNSWGSWLPPCSLVWCSSWTTLPAVSCSYPAQQWAWAGSTVQEGCDLGSNAFKIEGSWIWTPIPTFHFKQQRTFLFSHWCLNLVLQISSADTVKNSVKSANISS